MTNPAIQALLKNQLSRRQHYIQENKLEAYRLYNGEEEFLPVAIDIYSPYAVIHMFDKIESRIMQELEEVLKNLLKIESVFYKDRTKQKLPLPKKTHTEIIIKEYGHAFLINVSDYLDTGLFLDHRETRKWIGEKSAGKVVLNTFAYTGSFSIYAAANGAKKTYSVDLSGTYCEWIKKNFQLNNLPLGQNWVYKMDTLEFFKYAKKKSLFFDIIIIDPPTFSKNRNKNFSVQRDHPKFINSAIQSLTPDGFILFSNNYKNFSLKKSELIPCQIESKNDTIPPDFAGLTPHHCFIIRAK